MDNTKQHYYVVYLNAIGIKGRDRTIKRHSLRLENAPTGFSVEQQKENGKKALSQFKKVMHGASLTLYKASSEKLDGVLIEEIAFCLNQPIKILLD